MAARFRRGPAASRHYVRRIARYPQRVLLAALMSAAVTVLERRIRTALSHPRDAAGPTGGEGV
jgi:hypothetical protein